MGPEAYCSLCLWEGTHRCTPVPLFLPRYFCLAGFVEKEIKKANIQIVDTGENPEVPFPRDMIDLEVTALYLKDKQ